MCDHSGCFCICYTHNFRDMALFLLLALPGCFALICSQLFLVGVGHPQWVWVGEEAHAARGAAENTEERILRLNEKIFGLWRWLEGTRQWISQGCRYIFEQAPDQPTPSHLLPYCLGIRLSIQRRHLAIRAKPKLLSQSDTLSYISAPTFSNKCRFVTPTTWRTLAARRRRSTTALAPPHRATWGVARRRGPPLGGRGQRLPSGAILPGENSHRIRLHAIVFRRAVKTKRVHYGYTDHKYRFFYSFHFF